MLLINKVLLNKMGGQPPKPPGQMENTSSSSLLLRAQDVVFPCPIGTVEGMMCTAKWKALPNSDRKAMGDGFVFLKGDFSFPFF
jgi:hypothetical protein